MIGGRLSEPSITKSWIRPETYGTVNGGKHLCIDYEKNSLQLERKN